MNRYHYCICHQFCSTSKGEKSSGLHGTVKYVFRTISLVLTLFLVIPGFADDAQEDYETAIEAYNQGLYDITITYLKKAAKQGHPDAQNDLGNCYRAGVGVEEDYEEAVKWYRKAAEQNNPLAQFNLGISYEGGNGVEQDYEEAVKWYRKAAEQGMAPAQFNLGLAYAYSRGVEQNEAEAAKWYQKAAEQGIAEAQYNLGLCYLNGKGVEINPDVGMELIRLAASQGLPEAESILEKQAIAWWGALLVLILFVPIFVFKLISSLHKKSHEKALSSSCENQTVIDSNMCPSNDNAKEAHNICEAHNNTPRARADYRWGARIIDLFLGSIVFESIITVLGFGAFLGALPLGTYTFISLPFAFLLDSAIHMAFGNTLGKWLFGIKVIRHNCVNLTFREYLYRNLKVYCFGFAFGLPVFNAIAMLSQYFKVSKGNQTNYDKSLNTEAVEYKKSAIKTFFGIILFLLVFAWEGYVLFLGKET